MMACAVRPLHENDVPYVLECWVQTERRHSRASNAHIRALAREQLSAHGARVAVVPDDADAILGFVCVERGGRVLMAYVRRAARGMGICRQLFERSATNANHGD